MRIRSLGDVIATAIAWFPLLAILAFVAWVLAVGAMNLESRTHGSQYFVSEQESASPNYYAHNQGDELVTPF